MGTDVVTQENSDWFSLFFYDMNRDPAITALGGYGGDVTGYWFDKNKKLYYTRKDKVPEADKANIEIEWVNTTYIKGDIQTGGYDYFKYFGCWEKLFCSSNPDMDFSPYFIHPNYTDLFFRVKYLFNRHKEYPTVLVFKETNFTGESKYLKVGDNLITDIPFTPKSIINDCCKIEFYNGKNNVKFLTKQRANDISWIPSYNNIKVIDNRCTKQFKGGYFYFDDDDNTNRTIVQLMPNNYTKYVEIGDMRNRVFYFDESTSNLLKDTLVFDSRTNPKKNYSYIAI